MQKRKKEKEIFQMYGLKCLCFIGQGVFFMLTKHDCQWKQARKFSKLNISQIIV